MTDDLDYKEMLKGPSTGTLRIRRWSDRLAHEYRREAETVERSDLFDQGDDDDG